MHESPPESRLDRSAAQLRSASVALAAELRSLETLAPNRLPRLAAAVGKLAAVNAARPPVDPERYIRDWENFQSGGDLLSSRAIRHLCWVPSISSSREFNSFLDESRVALAARSLQGLVRAYHATWNDTEESRAFGRQTAARLGEYTGQNRVISLWLTEMGVLFGSAAATKLARKICDTRPVLSDFPRDWALDADSTFFVHAITNACRQSRERLDDGVAAAYWLHNLLGWEHWPLASLKAELSEAILDRHVTSDDQLRESLRQVVLGHLFDPRLPRNNWAGMDPRAREEFLGWMTREDIVFFFDHVLPRGKDRHGRKRFWLNYVRAVKFSRPLLSHVDKSRLEGRGLKSRPHFGEIKGPNNNSAFLLRFESVLAVEFSNVGRVYFFDAAAERRIVPLFWSSDPFSESALKNTQLCIDSFPHLGGWQDKVGAFLRRRGIHPTVWGRT